MKKKKGAWNKRESFRAEEADMKEKLISLPSNFTHVTHMGPGDGKMILKDLPEVMLVLLKKIYCHMNFQVKSQVMLDCNSSKIEYLLCLPV